MCNISLFGGGLPDLVICRDCLQFNFYDFNNMQLNKKSHNDGVLKSYWMIFENPEDLKSIKSIIFFNFACLKNKSLVFHHTKAEGKPIYIDQH